jgi:hypothetical protein
MANPIEQLKSIAAGEAERLHRQARQREQRVNELKAELAKAESDLHSVQEALRRGQTYDPDVYPLEAYCPRCWVRDATRRRLTTLSSDTLDDEWECRECGIMITIEQ